MFYIKCTEAQRYKNKMFYCKVDLVTFMFDVKKMRFLLGKLNNYMHVARYHWRVRRRPHASDLSTRAVTLQNNTNTNNTSNNINNNTRKPLSNVPKVFIFTLLSNHIMNLRSKENVHVIIVLLAKLCIVFTLCIKNAYTSILNMNNSILESIQ